YDRLADGTLSQITDALGRKTTIAHGAGGPTQLGWPAGESDQWSYDTSGMATTWTRPDGSVVRYTASGSTLTTQLPSGATLIRQTNASTGGAFESGGPG